MTAAPEAPSATRSTGGEGPARRRGGGPRDGRPGSDRLLRHRLDRALRRSLPGRRPAPDHREVAGVIAACRELGVALVPQGGNTGLVGGSVPLGGEVVLSLAGLGSLEPVDDRAGQITAGAGVSLADLQRRQRRPGGPTGWTSPVATAATVGGTVATNAGGLRVLRYGDTRAQLVGLEAVLGTGAVISHLGGLVKDNTGYHLAGLLCGSEGTLAVVTAARLRLVPPSPYRTVALLAFASVDGAGRRRRAPAPGTPRAGGLRTVPGGRGRPGVLGDRSLGRRSRSAIRLYLLVEAADRTDPTGDWPRPSAALADVADVAVATEPARRAELWRYREAHTDAINTLGPPHKLDVTLPARRWPSSWTGCPPSSRRPTRPPAPGCSAMSADGNIHVNVTGRPPTTIGWTTPCSGLAAEPRGQHQRRARHRHGQAAVAPPQSQRGRDGGLSGPQAGARPGRDPEPQRPAPAGLSRIVPLYSSGSGAGPRGRRVAGGERLFEALVELGSRASAWFARCLVLPSDTLLALAGHGVEAHQGA